MVITQNKSLRIWSTVTVSWVRKCSRNVGAMCKYEIAVIKPVLNKTSKVAIY